MDRLSLTNPVVVTYAIAAAIMILTIMWQGWITVVRMMANSGGFVNPEDAKVGPANPKPRAGQLDLNDDVDRSRRIHRNDLENIPAFLAIGLLYVLIDPPLAAAQWLMFGFVAARLATRYASVRSNTSGSPATTESIETYLIDHVDGLDPDLIEVTTSWSPANNRGSTVQVSVSYDFAPIMPFIPIESIELASSSESIISN